MKVLGFVFVLVSGLFAFLALVYWLLAGEPAGTTMLALSAGLGLIPGSYLLWWAPRLGASVLLPDRDDAEISEGAGEIGPFPGPTVWPLAFAAGMVLGAVGLVFGVWPAVPGAMLASLAASGALLESRRRAG